MNKENIRLRASSSERWINCAGSARLEHGIPDVPSKYAEEGILAHELAAIRLNNLPPPVDIDKYLQYPGMLLTVDMYAQYINDIFKYHARHNENIDLFLVERKVDFSHVLPNAYDPTGTCDALILGDKMLHIIDLKYGKGIKVDVTGNTQLLLYAFGAIRDLNFFCDIEKLCLHIFQPRIGNVQWQYINVHELPLWKEFFIEKSQAALAIDAPRIPNKKWCKFCKAKNICPEYQEFNKPFSIDEFDTLTTKQEN